MDAASAVTGARTTVVCGSLAYDNIMLFRGRFGEHILPDKVQILNVAFEVPEFRREFGGCAGNIAYNLALLGDRPLMLAAAGSDFAPYRKRIEQLGMDTALISELPDQLTAQAYIITDLDDNQITAFHPGAMNHAHCRELPAETGAQLGLISPGRPPGHARSCPADARGRPAVSCSIRGRGCRTSAARNCATLSAWPPGSRSTVTKRKC